MLNALQRKKVTLMSLQFKADNPGTCVWKFMLCLEQVAVCATHLSKTILCCKGLPRGHTVSFVWDLIWWICQRMEEGSFCAQSTASLLSPQYLPECRPGARAYYPTLK